MKKDATHRQWRARHQRWLRFVQGMERAIAGGQKIAAGPSPQPLIAPRAMAYDGDERVIVCSPHPDDEALTGALPLRFRLEKGISVLNLAVTLGSKVSERARRLRELESSCQALGFRLTVAAPASGLNSVTPEGRKDARSWAKKVGSLTEIFERERPTVIFVPHEGDFHPAHIGTHYLVIDALRNLRRWRSPVMLLESEYWHGLANPNLMVGVTPEQEALLVMAAAEHAGEVARNPYHLLHPARMMDNVRRGAEVVGSAGGAAPDFKFAELYRVSFFEKKRIRISRKPGRILHTTETADPADLAAYFGDR